MRFKARLLAVPLLVGSLLLSGCSALGLGEDKANEPGGNSTTTACPTEGTTQFAKARFALHMGLALGTFRLWVYKPWADGQFKSGRDGRTAAMVKAGATAAFVSYQLKKAADMVKADPQLCKTLGGPIDSMSKTVGDLKAKVAKGDFGSLAAINTSLGALVKTASDKVGVAIPERTDMEAGN